MIDVGTVSALLDYDPASGVFTWKTRDRSYFKSDRQHKNWNARYPGTAAGSINPKGYTGIAVLDRIYRAHHLAWLFVHGKWPSDVVDHINGNRSDNRISNLRVVSALENSRHKTVRGWSATGRIGVTPYFYNGRQKYAARIRVDGRLRHLGYYASIDEASAAREAAEQKYGFSVHCGEIPKSKAVIRSRGFQRTRPEA